MTRVAWDGVGQREFETGVDRGVLYLPNNAGVYDQGFAWNGLVTVTEAPTGADAHPQYADNIKYLNLLAAEQFGATVDAFTYPDEFAECDGTAEPTPGVRIGQQGRKLFGLCYRTLVGNDLEGQEAGYKLHLVYGAQAAPSQKAYGTVNDSPSAITFSWAITTTPVDAGVGLKPAASLTVDSTTVDAGALATLEDILYGTAGADPRLPLPAEVVALFSGTVTTVETVAPAYNAATHTITIPATTGVQYEIDGEVQAPGDVVITEDTVVTATPAPGFDFDPASDTDWTYRFA
jgi:hypothetical protein